MSGTARAAMESGSAVGEKAATKTVMPKIAKRQGFSIPRPERTPIKLSETRKTGSSKASPKIKMIRSTKLK